MTVKPDSTHPIPTTDFSNWIIYVTVKPIQTTVGMITILVTE